MLANRSVSRREVAFRHELWRSGVRGYRVSAKLPGRPDLVFPGMRLAVFVNGCFWHGCPSCNLPRPRANAQFWADKLDANVARDRRIVDTLQNDGWDVVTVWEHEIRPDVAPRAHRLAMEIKSRRSRVGDARG
jgi:DNA mismatch endonuclease (patch repair protein)